MLLEVVAMTLPASFPAGTEFADVEGVPVSYSPGKACTAWDRPSGRPFPLSSFGRNGTVLSETHFRDRVKNLAHAPSQISRCWGT
jgi:hypothetical protein